MNTRTELPADEPVIVMTRLYDAPRPLVWQAMSEPKHVRQWWGGPGCANPVCDMDVRPGGLWKHVMRFADGRELHLDFVFLEVDPPKRLVWGAADHGRRANGPPSSRITVTLDAVGRRTRWTMVARFASLAERDAATAYGFTGPIAASSEALTDYLTTLQKGNASCAS